MGRSFGPLDSTRVSFLEDLVVGPDDFPNPITRRRDEDLIVSSKGPTPLTDSKGSDPRINSPSLVWCTYAFVYFIQHFRRS